MLEENRYQAMITQHAWMFLSSFEKLRAKLQTVDTINMAHLGARAFEEIGGEVVQTTSFVMRKSHIAGYKGTYCRLIDPTTQKGKEEMYLAGENRYTAVQDNFTKIPGSPVAYWVSNSLVKAFADKLLGDYAYTKQGFATGNNEFFLRMWFEVEESKSAVPAAFKCEDNKFTYKWFPCNKGGSYRRWYGNNSYLANWEKDGELMRNYNGSVIRNSQFYFKEGITWSSLANQLSLRYSPVGFVFESKGSMCYTKGEVCIWYLLGLLNSKVASATLSILSPTLDFHEGPMAKIPVIKSDRNTQIEELTKNNVYNCKVDWDSFETSWDFTQHPLIRCASFSIEDMHEDKKNYMEQAYKNWENECFLRFNQLKSNEEELNRIFIDIYGLQDELAPEVEDKDVTVRKAIIFKYFKIISIVEFGSGTFMKTGTNTIALFLERRSDNDCLAAERAVKTFIQNQNDVTVLGIENAFSKYVATVYDNLSLDDYISFIKGKVNNKMQKHELFVDYQKAFGSDCYTQGVELEKEKMLYFMLTYSQNTVVVKTGSKQEEKDFLGYEFSERRGHEGMKRLPNGTKLYDESTNLLNPQIGRAHV